MTKLKQLLDAFEDSVSEYAFMGNHQEAEVRKEIKQNYAKAKKELMKYLNTLYYGKRHVRRGKLLR